MSKYPLHSVDTHQRLLDFTDATVAQGDKASSNIYEATPPRAFRRLIASLPLDPQDFSFVDLGSGKGRVLLLASSFPFRQVIGVEFAQELHLQAEQNIARYRGRRQLCRQVSSVYGDAAAYVFPEGNLLIFIFNSFKPPLLACVIEHIEATYAANPRKIYVLFYYPLEDAPYYRPRPRFIPGGSNPLSSMPSASGSQSAMSSPSSSMAMRFPGQHPFLEGTPNV